MAETGAMGFAIRMWLRLFRRSFLTSTEVPPALRASLRFRLRFFVAFTGFELFNALCLLLDRLLVPGWRRVRVEEPIFLIGNPRSGTTLLHRMLAEDEQRFFGFRTWEILFPSALQKIFLSALGTLDRLTGSHGRTLLERFEARRFKQFQQMHRIGLFLSEEDGLLLFHILAASVLRWLFPDAGFERIAKLDVAADAQVRRQIMGFYLGCVRRQAWLTGRGRTFLSKNPAFSGKVANLERLFPGCRFIYLVRNPLDVVPSLISMGRHVMKSRAGVEPDAELDERVYEIVKFNYTYTLDRIDAMPEDRGIVVNYDDLVRQPKQAIERIYKQFGFALTPEFEGRVDRAAAEMQRYRSRHEYSGDRYGVSRARMVADLRPVFDRFGFDTRETSDSPLRTSGQ